MEIKQLRYFVKAAELKSVGKAADLLNIAQPTLSRQIQALELELKADLFARDGRGVRLTPMGQRFLDHARGMLHAADSAVDALREGKSAYDGRVLFGLTPSLGFRLIRTFVDRFSRQFPKASLSIVEGYSAPLSEQVLMGKIDFAILLNPSASPNLTVDPITTEHLYLIGTKPVGPEQDDVRLEALAGLPLIMPHTPHTIRPLLEYEAARLGVGLNVVLEVDSVRAISQLIEAGYGYTVMPMNAVRANARSRLSWQRIVAPAIVATICLLNPARRPQTALVAEAAALARSTLVELIGA